MGQRDISKGPGFSVSIRTSASGERTVFADSHELIIIINDGAEEEDEDDVRV